MTPVRDAARDAFRDAARAGSFVFLILWYIRGLFVINTYDKIS